MSEPEATVPAVSVLVPVYNGERWLPRALESALAQTFGDFELIVVDDGSTDESAAVVESFARRDPRVRLVRTAHGGVRAARSRSLAEARAPLVAFLDADDEWLPRRLERELPYADERTVVFADSYMAHGDQLVERRFSGWCAAPDLEYPAAGMFPHLLERGCFLMIGTVLAPRRPLVDAGGFRYPELNGLSSAEVAEDFEMWLLLALAGVRFHYIDEPLAVYRRHADSLSVDWLWPRSLFAEAVVLESLLPRARRGDRRLLRRQIRKRLEVAHRKRGWQLLLGGDARAARSDLVRSLRAHPYSPQAWLALSLTLCPPLARRLVRGRV